MGRKRIYASTALRQQAYRERLKTGRESAAPRSIDGAKLEEFYRKLRRRPVPSTDQCRFAAEWMSKAFALYGTELHPRLGEARKPAKRVRKLLLEVRENNQSLGLLARDRQINAELQGVRMVAPNADPCAAALDRRAARGSCVESISRGDWSTQQDRGRLSLVARRRRQNAATRP